MTTFAVIRIGNLVNRGNFLPLVVQQCNGNSGTDDRFNRIGLCTVPEIVHNPPGFFRRILYQQPGFNHYFLIALIAVSKILDDDRRIRKVQHTGSRIA